MTQLSDKVPVLNFSGDDVSGIRAKAAQARATHELWLLHIRNLQNSVPAVSDWAREKAMSEHYGSEPADDE